jgi:hypothetical protein
MNPWWATLVTCRCGAPLTGEYPALVCSKDAKKHKTLLWIGPCQ